MSWALLAVFVRAVMDGLALRKAVMERWYSSKSVLTSSAGSSDSGEEMCIRDREGINVVVSHGNGPQVGMINNAFAYASANDGKTPEMPFPEAGAMSQGYIGYQLSQAILNDMKLRGIDRSTACVVTQTVVDPADPAFQNPTKPVGAFLSEEEAKAKAAETGWTFKEDAGRGWRQVVASPKPVRIVEFDAVKDLMDAGYIVVSTGGGGVPVFEKEGLYEGVPAVIDKDRSSAKLAADFGADMLVILTAVEKVCVNFGKPDPVSYTHLDVYKRQAQYLLHPVIEPRNLRGRFTASDLRCQVESGHTFLPGT